MKRILVIRLTALGDVVLAEPVARALKGRFSGVAVDLLTETRHAALMADASGFDAVIPYDRRGADAGWGGMGQVIARLSGPYDLIVDLQGKLRTRILAMRLGGRRITLRKRTWLQALGALLGSDPPLNGMHATQVYLRAVASLGIDGTAVEPRLALPARSRPAALRIGLCPGTTHATKRWPADRFAALADSIAEAHPAATFVIIGGPADRAVVSELRLKVTRANIDPRDVTALDVRELAGELAGLDALVGVDSGPAHIAAALGVSVVALFGPTSSVRWGPRGDAHEVVSMNLECAPCSNIGGAECPLPERNHACMQTLPVETVLGAVQRVLTKRGAR